LEALTRCASALFDPPAYISYIVTGSVIFVCTEDGWNTGKTLTFANGKGDPDSEDLTLDADGLLYTCTERDNADSKVNKLSVLTYTLNDGDNSTQLVADSEWDFTDDFPDTASNYAFEAITWIPDEYLVAQGFVDESTNKLYTPSAYPSKVGGNGIILVGHEGFGMIYAYVLLPQGNYQMVATFASGQKSIQSMFFDKDTGYLWSVCDNTCDGLLDVHQLNNTSGKFEIIATYNRPTTMPNFNNEGFTISPSAECDVQTGQRYVYWSDDDNDDGHSIRRDTIPCGHFI
jgi:hypothetical protein